MFLRGFLGDRATCGSGAQGALAGQSLSRLGLLAHCGRGRRPGHCSAPRLSPRSGLSMGVPQPLKIDQAGGSEPQAWLILWTRAHIRVAWATPTRPLRSRSARHLTGTLSGGVRGGRKPILWTRAHLPVAWATPTRPLRSGFARHPVNPCRLEPRALPLAMTRTPAGARKPPRRLRRGAEAPSISVMISARPRGAQDTLGGLCGDVGGEHGRSAASTPLRACGPARPSGRG